LWFRFFGRPKRPVQRCFGTLELRHEIRERDRGSAIGEDGVEMKDAVEFVHGVLRWSGCSGDITPSMASLPSSAILGRSFGRFDEILYLVEKYTRPHPRPARRVNAPEA
jgi:hypothetical protein